MIHIEKDMEVFGDPTLKVATATGDYEDSALVEFYDATTPETVAGAYQAQFIKYGNLVYQFNEPRELGEAILKIDPTSTHSTASYVRMTNELLAQMNSGALEPTSLDQALATEQVTMQEAIDNPVGVPEEVSTSTPISLNESVNESPVESLGESVVPAMTSSPQTSASTTLEATAVSTTTPSTIATETSTTTASANIAAVAETTKSITEAVETIVEAITGSTTPQ